MEGTLSLDEFMGTAAPTRAGTMTLDEFMGAPAKAAPAPNPIRSQALIETDPTTGALSLPDSVSDEDFRAAYPELIAARQRAAGAGHDPADPVWQERRGMDEEGLSVVGRGLREGIGRAGMAVLGGSQKIKGDQPAADETAATMQQFGEAAHRDNSWLNNQVQGTVSSLSENATFNAVGGPLGKVAGYTAMLLGMGYDSYASSRQDALKGGATDEEAEKIGRANAALEVSVSAAFSAVGLGGMEKQLTEGLAWKGVKEAAKQIGAELAEEEITSLGQQYVSAIKPGNLSGKKTWENVRDTAVQTLLTMGVTSGSSKAIDFVNNPSRRTAKAAGVDSVAPSFKARSELADTALLGVAQKVSTDWVRTNPPAPPGPEIAGELPGPTEPSPNEPPGPHPNFTPLDEQALGVLSKRLKRKMRDAGFRSDEMGPTLDGFQRWFRAKGFEKLHPGVETVNVTTNPPQPAEAAASSTPPPVVPSAAAAGIVPKSVLQLNAIGDTAASAARGAARWFKQNFQSGGEQNESTRKLLFQRNGIVRGHLAELSQNSRDLKAAVYKAYKLPRHKQIPETISQQLDAALKDPAALAALPTELAVPLQRMRDHVDALSKTVQAIPGISAELDLSIQNNLGTYITRTYEKFGRHPDAWAKKALNDPQIMADFSAEVRQTSPSATDEEIQQLAQTLLARNTTSLADLGKFTGRSQKYVNVLKQRKDLSPAVRKLYGERTDAFQNYTETVGKLANLTANRLFVNELKNAGIAEGFMSDSTAPQPGHIKEVNHAQLPQLRGLEGVLMEPEIADSINDIYTTRTPGKAERAYLIPMGLAKAAKTVGSIQATIRNFTGNIPIALANGAWNPKDFAGAGKATWWHDMFNKGDAKARADIRRLHELGLIEGVTVESLQDIAAHTSADLADYIAGIDSRNHVKIATRAVGKVYQAQDTIWKVHTYFNELRVLKAAHPGANVTELEIQAARNARAITPTYSEASKAAKFWSRYVPFGPFAMFNAEMFRTTANRLRLMKEELSSGNPALRRHGAKRMAGQAAVLAAGSAAAMVAKQMLGMSDDEEEALRQRVAPWQRNSALIPYSRDPATGKIEYFDAGYNDPFSVFTNPLIALGRGEGAESAGELAEPFLSEDLAYGALVSALRNKDQNGRPIYDAGLSPSAQNQQIAKYFLEKFEPGTITSMRRLARGAKGEVSRGGKQYDLANEALSVAAGVRLETMDRAQSDYFRNREYNQKVQDSEGSIRRMFMQRGTVDLEQVRQQYASAEANRKRGMEEWRKYVDGSILLGETRPYAKVVLDVGMESKIVKQMYSKQYRPYLFRDVDLRKMLSLPQGKERLALYRELISGQP